MKNDKPEIVKGHYYRAIKPVSTRGFIADRKVVDIRRNAYRYISPSSNGQWMTRAKFEAWAHEDITDHIAKLGNWELSK